MKHLIGVYDYTVVLTYMSLLSALTGMIQTAKGHFTAAVLCIMVSGLLDAFDGPVARTKKNRTEDEKGFGIQLDSLCDVISFGVVPAFLCYRLGADGILGHILVFLYILCALIRLAFFNVLETKRQAKEGGSGKIYRGLPVTTIAIILPVIYMLKFIMDIPGFTAVVHVMLAVVSLLFVLDFQVRKPNWARLLSLRADQPATDKEYETVS